MNTAQEQEKAPNGRVLVVDDARLTRAILVSALTDLGYESVEAGTGVEALEMLAPDIDLILLDIVMPEMSGFAVAEQIRSGGYCDDVPIIMVTSSGSMRDRLMAVESGASDFICKPIENTELRVRINNQIKIKRAQDAARDRLSDIERIVVERTSSLEEANAKLASLANTDALTGLPNHRTLVARLEEDLAACHALGQNCSVLFVDVDHFKALNDTFGHGAGDTVLKGFASILHETVGTSGVCGRWGGEEFVAILPGADAAAAAELGEVFRQAVAKHAFIESVGVNVTCSIGVSVSPLDGDTRTELAEAADRAMYVAKALGRNQVRIASETKKEFEGLQGNAESREETALRGLVEALTAIIAARDPRALILGPCIEKVSADIGATMNLNSDEKRMLRLVSRLYAIGKIAVPDSILVSGEPLTDEEWSYMRQHPVVGAEIVSRAPALRGIAKSILAHYEHWDGTGYPDGLVGNAAPLAARIVAVAAIYAELTLNAKCPIEPEEALAKIQSEVGSRFDPTIVGALAQSIQPVAMAA